jgi:hypothetical protein
MTIEKKSLEYYLNKRNYVLELLLVFLLTSLFYSGIIYGFFAPNHIIINNLFLLFIPLFFIIPYIILIIFYKIYNKKFNLLLKEHKLKYLKCENCKKKFLALDFETYNFCNTCMLIRIDKFIDFF